MGQFEKEKHAYADNEKKIRYIKNRSRLFSFSKNENKQKSTLKICPLGSGPFFPTDEKMLLCVDRKKKSWRFELK
jgi:hypothetical protein